MAARNESSDESLASPDGPADEDLPGELLNAELVDPGDYVVAPDEAEAEELAASAFVGGAPQADDIDDPIQLAAAQSVADQARTSRPQRRVAEVPAKGAATPKNRARSAASVRRTTPATFVAESVDELKKVVWPTGPQVQQFFWAVLVLVLFVIAYVSLIDLGLGALLLKLLG